MCSPRGRIGSDCQLVPRTAAHVSDVVCAHGVTECRGQGHWAGAHNDSARVEREAVRWSLSSEPSCWVAGVMASPSAHLTCQLHFFGLTS